MNTKNIGNIGEAKVITKFIELGISVYIPFGDNERADLIAEFNNKLNKIQVKTSSQIKNGAISFQLHSCNHLTNMTERKYINKAYSIEDVDYFALYNIVNDNIYLIENDNTVKSIRIRIDSSKNNQSINIKSEKDYLIEKVLCVETLHGVSKDS